MQGTLILTTMSKTVVTKGKGPRNKTLNLPRKKVGIIYLRRQSTLHGPHAEKRGKTGHWEALSTGYIPTKYSYETTRLGKSVSKPS